MPIASSRTVAQALDARDPLRTLRNQFELPDGVIYLDGNSLGAPPKAALARLRQTAEAEWREGLVKSWNTAGWFELPKTCGAKIAAIIGVTPDEVITADNVSVNIFKLASALWASDPGAIAYEAEEFPTDGYILQGLSQLTGAKLLCLPELGTQIGPEAASESIPAELKVLVKSVVHYKTAAVVDIPTWEAVAARKGFSIIWDLSHAAGVMMLDLNTAGAQFAVGCGYKYLNGGPGAPAFIYVAHNAAKGLNQPLSGWMGHAAPFDFSDDYAPATGVHRFASGTPPILSLSALDAALDLFADISITALENKAIALGDLFLSRCEKLDLHLNSPMIGTRRGGHIALRHPHAYEVMQALIAQGVIGDFRMPDLMRFGFSPLYTQYTDIWDATDILQTILENQLWREPKFAQRNIVT